MIETKQQNSSAKDYLDAKKEVVDAFLDRVLPAADLYPRLIHEAMRYSIFAGGKRVRPILALATGEALGGDLQPLLHLAGALEMIHTYSLIHDDLPAMDNDDVRRGMPTLHRKYGEGIAILAGDGLLTLAFQLLGETPGNAAFAERKLAMIHRVCRAIGTQRGMIAGQIVDLTTQGKEFSREELEYIHSSKTGALIHASVYCAAMLCDSNQEQRNHLSSYAANLGLAFQIVDDILDVTATSSQLGKTTGKDSLHEKATYPAMYGLEESRRIADRLIDGAVQDVAGLGVKGRRLRDLARFIGARQN